MKKKYQEKYKGKIITLVLNDSKLTDFYDAWAWQFKDELFSAIKVSIDGGEDSATVLRNSLEESFGLSRTQKEQLLGLLPYFVVEDQRKITLPQFELPLPRFLKEKKKRAIGFAVRCLMLFVIPIWAAFYFMNKNESPRVTQTTEIATPKTDQQVTPTATSRFQDLVVGDRKTPIINTSPTLTKDCESAIESQAVEEIEGDETPTLVEPTTTPSIQTTPSMPINTSANEHIKSLILADDQKSLSKLFVGSRIRLEVAGCLSDFISEDANRILLSGGKMKLIYDHDGNLLKKVIISKM